MAKYIVEMQMDKQEKFYFIREDTEVLDRNRIWRATLRNPRKPSVR